MEDWVIRAMKRWPNVPALFGWLALDRRGRWLIQGEPISHPLIVQSIDRNYSADEHGRWFFQNGPQRGYITLECAPLLLRRGDCGDVLMTHTGLRVERPSAAYLDEQGSMLLMTEHGPGEIAGDELEWLMLRLRHDGEEVTDEYLAAALATPSGKLTRLLLQMNDSRLPVMRLDAFDAPTQLGFVRDPQPREGERISAGTSD